MKMKLTEITSKINKIDRELLVLLQERMGLALRSNKFQEIGDAAQNEENVLERVNRMNLDLIESSFSRQLLKTIIDESKRLQDEDRCLVAFQGEHGAYGEVASRKLMPAGAYIPCLEFIDVFRGVEEGQFDLGVVPVENSLEGAVTQVNDLLTTTELKVVGEVKVDVNHCLLATEATDYREIRVVYSHPQALAQCRDFLMRNKLEPRPYYDTAGAAKMLARENPKAAAAIASALCAELYDLEIIKEGIEDGPSNSTRFLLLARDAIAGKKEKTSIIFAVAHEAGQLFGVLQLFAEANINLTRISSMPLRSDPSNYSFFLDFEGSQEDAHVAQVLDRMHKMTISLKNLGSYPAYKGKT
jgi:prephenate dehydratase/chorismate mutase